MKPVSTPLITVATVTYNAATTLPSTLASVEAQTYPCVEHIIVDGCSRDDTFALIQRYVERRGTRVRVVREPDHGIYDAMNKALALATGAYIVFLNAGDRFHEATTLEKLVEAIHYDPRAVNPAVVYGETDLVDHQGRFLRHRRLRAPEELAFGSFLQGMLVCHQSFYVRTDLARLYPYDLRYRYSADYDWCLRLLARVRARRLPVLNTHLILTDYLAEGTTTRHHRASLLERLRIMAHHYGWPRAIMAHAWFVVRAVVRA